MGNAVKSLNKIQQVTCEILDHWTLKVNLFKSSKERLDEVLKAIKDAEGYVETDPHRVIKKSKAKGFSPLDYPVFG